MRRWMVFAALLAACTDEDGARRALMNEGFSDISLKGYDAFSCGKDDATSTKFEATNAKGQRVSGVVCCGYFSGKGCTVRW